MSSRKASVAVLLVAAVPAAGWAQIEEIMVTVRKTTESLQDVPLAVSAFDQEFIEKQGLATTADVLKLVPGVQFDQAFSAADTRISIRGISNSRGRASVATLIDGVDVSGENITSGGGSSLLNTRLADLERIEIIKGPQSALYGRNAFAGAINYITRQPSMDDVEVRAFADAAFDYDIYDLRASVSWPLIEDVLAVSINGATFSHRGYYKNNNPIDPIPNVGLGGSESDGLRFTALWTPTDTVAVTWNIAYTENRNEPRPVVKVAPANTFYLDGVRLPAGTQPDYNFNGAMNYGQWLGTVSSVSETGSMLSRSERDNQPFRGSEDESLLTYLKVNWDTDRWAFKSLTSYLKNDAFLHEDAEFQSGVGTPITRPGPVFTNFSLDNDYFDETETQYVAQEFTIEYTDWQRGRILFGVYGFWEETENTDHSIGWFNDPNFEAGFPTFCPAQDPLQLACSYRDSVRLGTPPKTTDRETESFSVFGLIGFDITENLRATVEARYIRDEIEVTTNTSVDRVGQYVLAIPIDFSVASLPGGTLPTSDTQKTETINPRFALDYRLAGDAMLYGSVGKGTKPAGFGTVQFAVPQNTKIDEETLWAYEFGVKSTWFDNTLQANVALFFNDYEDRQVGVTVTDPISNWASAGVKNAASAETKGVEMDFTWRPTDPLTLGLAYAYTDAEWKDFDYTAIRAQTGRSVRPKDQAICGNATGDCAGGFIAGVPEHAASLQANITAPLVNDIEWFVNAIGEYQSERALNDQVNTPFVDEYFIVDAQIGIQTESWTVQLYANNLFDDDTVRWAQPYNDFRDGMYGGSAGGEPRDETVFAFLPSPRVVGLRATFRFGR